MDARGHGLDCRLGQTALDGAVVTGDAFAEGVGPALAAACADGRRAVADSLHLRDDHGRGAPGVRVRHRPAISPRHPGADDRLCCDRFSIVERDPCGFFRRFIDGNLFDFGIQQKFTANFRK